MAALKASIEEDEGEADRKPAAKAGKKKKGASKASKSSSRKKAASG
jgi:hypothetical protein